MLRPLLRGLLIPLILALITGAAAWLLLEQHIAQRVERLEPVVVQAAEQQQVVVPGQTLFAGDTLTASQLMARDLDLRSLPSDTLTPADLESYLGLQLAAEVPAGRPLQRLHLQPPDPPAFVQLLGAGYRPVTMRYDQQEQHAGLVTLGAVLDLYQQERGALQLLLTGVRVVATDNQWQAHQPEADLQRGGYQTLTLAIPEREVAQVREAIQRNTLVTLLRAEDDPPQHTQLAGVREVEYILPGQQQNIPEAQWP